MSFLKIHYWLPVLQLIPFTLFATEVNYSAGLIITSYDNLNLVADPVEGETSYSARGALTITENTADLIANVDASLESIRYQNNQADDENLGNLLANALWTIYPGQFQWYIADTYTQTLTDYLAPNTPDNRVDSNAFTTGPNFIFRINSRNNLNIEARVETIRFDNAVDAEDSDNDRVNIASIWEYELQTDSTISLNYTIENVDYKDDNLNDDFDRNDLFLAFSHLRGMNTYQADAGLVNINYKNIEDIDETRFRLSVLNTRTRTSTLQLELSKDISDTSRELLDRAADEQVDISISNDVFLEQVARIVYNQVTHSGYYNLNLNKTTNDYQHQDQLDETELGALFTANWNVQRASRLTFAAQYTNSTYDNIDREDDDSLYSLLYSYNARRYINVGIEAISEKRISSDPLNDYEDFRLILSLIYTTE